MLSADADADAGKQERGRRDQAHRTEAINSRVYQPGFSIILIILLGIPGVISRMKNPPLCTVCLRGDSPAVGCY